MAESSRRGAVDRLRAMLASDPGFEVWPHPYQVDHRDLSTVVNPHRVVADQSLRSKLDRRRLRLLVSSAGVRVESVLAGDHAASSFP